MGVVFVEGGEDGGVMQMGPILATPLPLKDSLAAAGEQSSASPSQAQSTPRAAKDRPPRSTLLLHPVSPAQTLVGTWLQNPSSPPNAIPADISSVYRVPNSIRKRGRGPIR